ncbi:MAG: heparinase II/III family protein [Rubrivivax sp.]
MAVAGAWCFRHAFWFDLALLIAVLAAVWLPELKHWYVRPQALDDAALAALRRAPETAQLTEIGQMQLRGVAVPRAQRLAAAESVARGVLKLPDFPDTPIELPFSPHDLDKGSPTWGLMFASLAAADLLIDGYADTGNEAWFRLARDMIDGFARHEDARWIDQGLMWNDHATSARVPVLVKFWALYRQRADFDPALARRLLKLVARSALLLSRADAYAWRTSHGVIADLALLEIAQAFPALPEAGPARRLATQRVSQHLRYWINAEGMTLLHSAGYHSASLYHLSLLLRLHSLAGQPAPEDWWTRFDRALAIEAMLRRPDGSLPLFGDTMNLPDAEPPWLTRRASDGLALPVQPRPLPAAGHAALVLPAAGYAFWRDDPSEAAGAGGQTTMAWAKHQGLGHKLADELSVLTWSRGRTWVTNTGYWPYGDALREEAESWAGSNAPHLAGEPKSSQRQTQALTSAAGPSLQFVEAERLGPDGLRMRRQLLRIPAVDAWIVIDHSQDTRARSSRQLWTWAPDLQVRPLTDGAWNDTVASQGQGVAQRISLQTSSSAPVVPFRGSRAPLRGWVVEGREPRPATALLITRPTQEAWMLSTFANAASEPAARAWPVSRMQVLAGP